MHLPLSYYVYAVVERYKSGKVIIYADKIKEIKNKL